MVFHTALPLVEYQLNKEYIIQELCENKDVVASCCEGSCYLDKKIKKAQEEDEKVPSLRTELQTEYLPRSSVPFPTKRIFLFDDLEASFLPDYCFSVKTAEPRKVLKPPTV